MDGADVRVVVVLTAPTGRLKAGLVLELAEFGSLPATYVAVMLSVPPGRLETWQEAAPVAGVTGAEAQTVVVPLVNDMVPAKGMTTEYPLAGVAVALRVTC